MSEKITFETEDGDIELYVLEQTTLFGVNYIQMTKKVRMAVSLY